MQPAYNFNHYQNEQELKGAYDSNLEEEEYYAEDSSEE